jgi:hypothetical protein
MCSVVIVGDCLDAAGDDRTPILVVAALDCCAFLVEPAAERIIDFSYAQFWSDS